MKYARRFSGDPTRRPPVAACAGLLAAILPVLTGCQGLMYLFHSEDLKDVKAECDKLAGQRVAVVVWAEQSTLDADAFACDRTARAVLYFFAMNNRQKELKGTTFVPPEQVAEFQERVGNTGPTLPNDEVASRLKADAILRIDLFEYTTRPPEANGLILGRVSANVALYMTGEESAVYRTDVSASWPEDKRIGVLDKTDEEVLTNTLNLFGDRVSRKFFFHKEKY